MTMQMTKETMDALRGIVMAASIEEIGNEVNRLLNSCTVVDPRTANRDREKDRRRFPDERFNRWLDEGVSDSGHTVYDTIAETADAWAGWTAYPYYSAPPASAEAKSVSDGQITLPDGLGRIKLDLWCFVVVADFEIPKERLDAYVALGLMERVQRSPAMYQLSNIGEAVIDWSPQQPAAAIPVAWLHTVTQGDGSETDSALSFSPDNFPLSGELGFRSLGAVPLYT